MDKQTTVIKVIGSSFSPQEVEAAHRVLDDAGVPREFGRRRMLLPERINWLNGMLVSAEQVIVDWKQEGLQ